MTKPGITIVLLASAFLLLCGFREGSAFAPGLGRVSRTASPASPATPATSSRLFLGTSTPTPPSNNNDDYAGDFPPEEETASEYTGSVDWDAEWKKVVKNGGKPKKISVQDRPGKDYYKSEAEIAAIRAANKATEQVNKVASQIPRAPSFDELKNDWRFWIGILAVISVGSSLLAGMGMSQQVPVTGSSETYYI